MSDTYLQDFGTRRSIHRSKPKTDPMAASGRWDDLYLRASKPRLRKTVRRDSMRRDTNVYFTRKVKTWTKVNGKRVYSVEVHRSKSIAFRPNGEVGKLLGFTCDNTKHKYKLDSPSYPARHRELSHEDKPRQQLQKLVPVGWKQVYPALREMIHKIRVRDPRFTRILVKDFKVLWPMRHELRRSIDRRFEAERMPAYGNSAPAPVARPMPLPETKATKPRRHKSLVREYQKNQAELESLGRFNEELLTRMQAARREELTARQRELFRMVGRWM